MTPISSRNLSLTHTLRKKKVFGLLTCGVALILVLMLGFQPAVSAQTSYITINGNWMISQAAASSVGSAPQVVACGTFTLSVTSASSSSVSGGTFAGTFTTITTYSQKPITMPLSEAVTGTWMSGSILGQPTLRVMFSGSSPVALAGSFASPPTQPTPSTPTNLPSGCTGVALDDSLFGFVQLPGQGTEGAFIYSTQTVANFPIA